MKALLKLVGVLVLLAWATGGQEKASALTCDSACYEPCQAQCQWNMQQCWYGCGSVPPGERSGCQQYCNSVMYNCMQGAGGCVTMCCH